MFIEDAMNERLWTPKELSKHFGVTPQTLKDWEINGILKCNKTKGGHRRYIYSPAIKTTNNQQQKKKFIYARVSSTKQSSDLQRQIASLQSSYPTFEVIKDIGSGINFKRRGLVTLLDKVFGGEVSEVVVAHKDRLTRFGFELFKHIFEHFGVSITVHSDTGIKEPISELAKDLLSIVTVFTARYYGSRTYKVLQKNKILSKRRAIKVIQ
jgi:predicted site-specific integrase-resolvase